MKLKIIFINIVSPKNLCLTLQVCENSEFISIFFFFDLKTIEVKSALPPSVRIHTFSVGPFEYEELQVNPISIWFVSALQI